MNIKKIKIQRRLNSVVTQVSEDGVTWVSPFKDVVGDGTIVYDIHPVETISGLEPVYPDFQRVPHCKTHGTVMGRCSCKTPNSKEVDRYKNQNWHKLYGGKGFPHALLHIDFSKAEQRVMADTYQRLCEGRGKCHEEELAAKNNCPHFADDPSGWPNCRYVRKGCRWES
ncbi:MAG: hypothetical protein ACYTBJ_00585 [Planctomycetota bacterium]